MRCPHCDGAIPIFIDTTERSRALRLGYRVIKAYRGPYVIIDNSYATLLSNASLQQVSRFLDKAERAPAKR